MNPSIIIKNILNIDKSSSTAPFATFFYRSKEEMKSAKGSSFTNIFYLNSFDFSENLFTHFTPNIFKTAYYTENGNLAGYTQKNLHQINCFCLDIDSKTQSMETIKNILIQNNLSPTLILNTEKGYHVFFKLINPIRTINDFSFAREISKSIRLFLKEKINHIDLGCNHFSIFRCPNKKNILYYNQNNNLDFITLKNRFIADEVKNSHIDRNTTIYMGNTQINTPWFKALFSVKKIDEKQTSCGRNNILFTLALACFSSKVTKEKCMEKLLIFNNNLHRPLEYSEFLKTINSAYSSKYLGATKEYILNLILMYRPDIKNPQKLFFYKHKKSRAQRKNSYIYEWQQDIKNWLQHIFKKSNRSNIKTSLKDISEKTKIPISSLKIALKNMEEKNIIKINTKKGKYGYTQIIFIKKYIKEIIEAKKVYAEKLLNYFKEIVKKKTVKVTKIRKNHRKSVETKRIVLIS